jgi:tRNA(Ile)-lysidine synthase
MASSKKPRSGERPDEVTAAVARFFSDIGLEGKRLVVGLSGGVDSVVLLHALHALQPSAGFALRAVHVHHGLSPNARAWTTFCRRYCKRLAVPLSVRRVNVSRAGKGLEAAARDARYAQFERIPGDALVLGHQLDDQAETVLLNLLRGAGARGASGMPARASLGDKALLRPLLEVPREAVERYAREQRLEWIEDESNADEGLTRNFLRRRVGPLLRQRFPRWRESLARAARLFAARELDASRLLREFLRARGMRAPSEAKLQEMLKQLGSKGARTLIEHDGKRLRVYRGRVLLERPQPALASFAPVRWNGERRIALPALRGELRFRPAGAPHPAALDLARLKDRIFEIRLRGGGERLQPDARRPRRTLKNLFQEAGVPSWERDRMPLIFCGTDLVWAPGLGVDQRYRARGANGVIPEWHREPDRVAKFPP